MIERLKNWVRKSTTEVPGSALANVAPASHQPEPAERRLRANIPWAGLAGLIQLGVGVIVPEPVVDIVEPKPAIVIEPTVVSDPTPEPLNSDTRPIDWTEEQRIDLSPRSPGRIAHLLRFETPVQLQARILNDGARYRNSRR